MKYYSSGKGHKKYRPKNHWLSSRRKKTSRVFRQYENTAAVRLDNPFKPKTKKNRLMLKGSILPILLLSWFSLLLYLPFFKVSKIEINGNKIAATPEIDDFIKQQITSKYNFWPKNNYFLINGDNLAEQIQNQFSFNNVVVEKTFPSSLNITVEEKVSAAIFDDGLAYYLMDEKGNKVKYLKPVALPEISSPSTSVAVVTSTITTSSMNTAVQFTSSTATSSIKEHIPDYTALKKDYGEYPIVYDSKASKAAESDSLLAKDSVAGMIEFYNKMKNEDLAKIKYFTMDNTEAGMTAVTNQSWNIIFRPEENISDQINNLKIILKNNHPVNYVDIRFGDRIYWK